MAIQKAMELFKNYQNGTVKKSPLKNYGKFLDYFLERFSAREVISVSADQIGRFIEKFTEGLSMSTRHPRYNQIKAFFNYVIGVTGANAKNTCNAAVLAKAYKNVPYPPRKILDKKPRRTL